MLDVLVVNPPPSREVYGMLNELAAIQPPVWAGLIAEYVRRTGLSVEILDAEHLSAGMTAAEILERHARLTVFCVFGHQPSASTQCMPGAIAVCTEAKNIANDQGLRLPTMVIGTHAAALPGSLKGYFDFVCKGEGPREVIDALNGQLRPQGLIQDLDSELPTQAWDLFDMKKYRAHNWHLWTGDSRGGYASVQTSLGCPFKCSFCCINAPFAAEAPRLRKWSPKNVVGQIKHLHEKYGITNIKIPDEMFVLDRNHVRGICQGIIDDGLTDLNMWAYARVDTVKDKELLDLMAKAGFKWLGIGVESGSKHVRDGVEKGRFGNEQIHESIDRVRKAGINVAANYIFGLPDDTHESMQATLDLAESLNTEYANFYCAMAYPGSQLHKEARLKGWKLPEDGPGWIGYSQHAYESLPLRTEELSYEEVLDFRDEAFMHYFTRPDYIGMMKRQFGEGVVSEIERMVSYGKPRRKHRDKETK